MNILGLFIFFGILVISLYYTWLAWLKPSKLSQIARDRREKASEALPIWGTLFQFDFFNSFPAIDIWLTRLAAPLLAVLSLAGVIFSLTGPIRGSATSSSQNTYSPLFQAAQRGDISEANRLLESGELINQITERNQTPLHIAAEAGQNEMVVWLLAHEADPLAQDRNSKTPLNAANSQDHRDTAQLISDFVQLLRSEDKALREKDFVTLRSLLTADIRQYTLLHLLAQSGTSSELSNEITSGANVNAVTVNGMTALHKAVLSGDLEKSRILLEAGTQVNAYDIYHNAPLYYAVSINNADIVSLLLEFGADTSIRSKYENETPTDLAARKGYDNIQVLLDAVNLTPSDN